MRPVGQLAQHQANGGGIAGMPQAVIDHVAIEIDLARVLGLEGATLEVDQHITAQRQVAEEPVDVRIVPVQVQVVLASDEGKALSQLEQELLQMGHQPRFQFPFMEFIGSRIRPSGTYSAKFACTRMARSIAGLPPSPTVMRSSRRRRRVRMLRATKKSASSAA
ncbi:MAG: hypothetical protein AW07_04749 [Candidatus Accumulibacter sp. SK-11]|nr:MAG: hypothetical protein AW07_04749 [Candidatus Accumulibacter sp. SK-11]